MADIVLATLNAKYIHPAFGLRYLYANLGQSQSKARLVEFDIHQRPLDIAEKILAEDPRVVGLGVYIWNVAPITDLVHALKRIAPEVVVVLGGPEVSYPPDQPPMVAAADYVICGEADHAFATLCEELLAGKRPEPRIRHAPLPDMGSLRCPYDAYTDEDLAHRVIYVEASRGCPFRCEFCLSSLDVPVRAVPLETFLEQMRRLLDRGARQLKFVDRTFNLNIRTSRAILEFCLRHSAPGRFFHFEMVPDRLPDELREVIARFPEGALQFEVGIQSFNDEVCRRIQRRQDFKRLEDNLRFLREQTGVHIHADLIAGLPGESLESFGEGFDRLIALRPQEIQVGILKRLRGTPIGRHDAEWDMVYNPAPPYEILRNRLLDFQTVQRLKRFARYWDLVGNSGNFRESAPLIWSRDRSPFAAFMRWSDWLYGQTGRTDSIALPRLVELLFRYLTEELRLDPGSTAAALARDYQRPGRRGLPAALHPWVDPHATHAAPSMREAPVTLRRQARHGASCHDTGSVSPEAG